MKIFVKNGGFSLVIIGLFILLIILNVLLSGSGSSIINVIITLLIIIYAIIHVFLGMNREMLYADNEKFVCKYKKRNINFEAPRSAIKIILLNWKKEKMDKTYDVPVVKIESNDGQSVSFSANDPWSYEWKERVNYTNDFDIELEWEKWEMIIRQLGIWDKLKKKPIIVPEKIRGPIVKIMYLLLFAGIILAGWVLYWGIFVQKVFEV